MNWCTWHCTDNISKQVSYYNTQQSRTVNKYEQKHSLVAMCYVLQLLWFNVCKCTSPHPWRPQDIPAQGAPSPWAGLLLVLHPATPPPSPVWGTHSNTVSVRTFTKLTHWEVHHITLHEPSTSDTGASTFSCMHYSQAHPLGETTIQYTNYTQYTRHDKGEWLACEWHSNRRYCFHNFGIKFCCLKLSQLQFQVPKACRPYTSLLATLTMYHLTEPRV